MEKSLKSILMPVMYVSGMMIPVTSVMAYPPMRPTTMLRMASSGKKMTVAMIFGSIR